MSGIRLLRKNFLTLAAVVTFSGEGISETYCYIDSEGVGNCLELGDGNGSGGVPANLPPIVGGGGCGGSSACGNNNLEIDWIPGYLGDQPERISNSDQMLKTFKIFQQKEIQRLRSSRPTSTQR